MKILITLILVLIFFQFNSFAQCYPDRHSTVKTDAWESCTTSMNPNTGRGVSHWIMYDLSEIKNLGVSTFWNYNDPDELDKGLRIVAIDYSVDGVDWVELGNFDFPQANGQSIYEGFKGPDFGGQSMRYLLITALDNYGDESCYGFSEMRVQLRSAILPVNIASFNGTCEDNQINFEWKVNEEVAISHYKIEASTEGEEWSYLGRVNAASKQTYQLENKNWLSDQSIFRLVSVDHDGLEKAHQKISLQCKVNNTTVFPNPFDSKFELVFGEDFEKDFELVLIDPLGRVVLSQNIDKNEKRKAIKTVQLPAGTYTLKLSNEFKSKEFKLVKI